MIWIYLGPAIFAAIIATVIFMAAFFGEEDADASMLAALGFVAAWLWPLVVPVAALVLVVFIFMHIFIMFEWMKAPKWWPELY